MSAFEIGGKIKLVPELGDVRAVSLAKDISESLGSVEIGNVQLSTSGEDSLKSLGKSISASLKAKIELTGESFVAEKDMDLNHIAKEIKEAFRKQVIQVPVTISRVYETEETIKTVRAPEQKKVSGKKSKKVKSVQEADTTAARGKPIQAEAVIEEIAIPEGVTVSLSNQVESAIIYGLKKVNLSDAGTGSLFDLGKQMANALNGQIILQGSAFRYHEGSPADVLAEGLKNSLETHGIEVPVIVGKISYTKDMSGVGPAETTQDITSHSTQVIPQIAEIDPAAKKALQDSISEAVTGALEGEGARPVTIYKLNVDGEAITNLLKEMRTRFIKEGVAVNVMDVTVKATKEEIQNQISEDLVISPTISKFKLGSKVHGSLYSDIQTYFFNHPIKVKFEGAEITHPAGTTGVTSSADRGISGVGGGAERITAQVHGKARTEDEEKAGFRFDFKRALKGEEKTVPEQSKEQPREGGISRDITATQEYNKAAIAYKQSLSELAVKLSGAEEGTDKFQMKLEELQMSQKAAFGTETSFVKQAGDKKHKAERTELLTESLQKAARNAAVALDDLSKSTGLKDITRSLMAGKTTAPQKGDFDGTVGDIKEGSLLTTRHMGTLQKNFSEIRAIAEEDVLGDTPQDQRKAKLGLPETQKEINKKTIKMLTLSEKDIESMIATGEGRKELNKTIHDIVRVTRNIKTAQETELAKQQERNKNISAVEEKLTGKEFIGGTKEQRGEITKEALGFVDDSDVRDQLVEKFQQIAAGIREGLKIKGLTGGSLDAKFATELRKRVKEMLKGGVAALQKDPDAGSTLLERTKGIHEDVQETQTSAREESRASEAASSFFELKKAAEDLGGGFISSGKTFDVGSKDMNEGLDELSKAFENLVTRTKLDKFKVTDKESGFSRAAKSREELTLEDRAKFDSLEVHEKAVDDTRKKAGFTQTDLKTAVMDRNTQEILKRTERVNSLLEDRNKILEAQETQAKTITDIFDRIKPKGKDSHLGQQLLTQVNTLRTVGGGSPTEDLSKEDITGIASKLGVSLPVSADPESIQAFLNEIEAKADAHVKSKGAGALRRMYHHTMLGQLEHQAKRLLRYYAIAGVMRSVSNSMREMIRTAIDFQKQMIEVTKVMDITQQRSEELASSLTRSATQFGFSLKETSEAAVVYAQQGKSVEEINKLVKASLLLANVSILTTKESTEVLTATMNQFYISADNAVGIIDKMSSVANRFAVTEGDMGDAIRRAGSAAAEAEVSLDSFIGMITALQERTRLGGKMIGTSLKTLFARMNTDEAIKQLNDVGIASFDMSGQFRSVEDRLSDLSVQWGSLNNVQKDNVAGALAMRRQYAMFIALMSGYRTVVAAADVASTAQGTAMSRNEKIMDSVSKSLSVARAEWEGLFKTIGDSGVLSTVETMAKGIESLSSSLGKLPQGVIQTLMLGGGLAASGFVGQKLVQGAKTRLHMQSGAFEAARGLATSRVGQAHGLLPSALHHGATRIGASVGRLIGPESEQIGPATNRHTGEPMPMPPGVLKRAGGRAAGYITQGLKDGGPLMTGAALAAFSVMANALRNQGHETAAEVADSFGSAMSTALMLQMTGIATGWAGVGIGILTQIGPITDSISKMIFDLEGPTNKLRDNLKTVEESFRSFSATAGEIEGLSVQPRNIQNMKEMERLIDKLFEDKPDSIDERTEMQKRLIRGEDLGIEDLRLAEEEKIKEKRLDVIRSEMDQIRELNERHARFSPEVSREQINRRRDFLGRRTTDFFLGALPVTKDEKEREELGKLMTKERKNSRLTTVDEERMEELKKRQQSKGSDVFAIAEKDAGLDKIFDRSRDISTEEGRDEWREEVKEAQLATLDNLRKWHDENEIGTTAYLAALKELENSLVIANARMSQEIFNTKYIKSFSAALRESEIALGRFNAETEIIDRASSERSTQRQIVEASGGTVSDIQEAKIAAENIEILEGKVKDLGRESDISIDSLTRMSSELSAMQSVKPENIRKTLMGQSEEIVGSFGRAREAGLQVGEAGVSDELMGTLVKSVAKGIDGSLDTSLAALQAPNTEKPERERINEELKKILGKVNKDLDSDMNFDEFIRVLALAQGEDKRGRKPEEEVKRIEAIKKAVEERYQAEQRLEQERLKLVQPQMNAINSLNDVYKTMSANINKVIDSEMNLLGMRQGLAEIQAQSLSSHDTTPQFQAESIGRITQTLDDVNKEFDRRVEIEKKSIANEQRLAERGTSVAGLESDEVKDFKKREESARRIADIDDERIAKSSDLLRQQIDANKAIAEYHKGRVTDARSAQRSLLTTDPAEILKGQLLLDQAMAAAGAPTTGADGQLEYDEGAAGRVLNRIRNIDDRLALQAAFDRGIALEPDDTRREAIIKLRENLDQPVGFEAHVKRFGESVEEQAIITQRVIEQEEARRTREDQIVNRYDAATVKFAAAVDKMVADTGNKTGSAAAAENIVRSQTPEQRAHEKVNHSRDSSREYYRQKTEKLREEYRKTPPVDGLIRRELAPATKTESDSERTQTTNNTFESVFGKGSAGDIGTIIANEITASVQERLAAYREQIEKAIEKKTQQQDAYSS